jgi:hypothetical protein
MATSSEVTSFKYLQNENHLILQKDNLKSLVPKCYKRQIQNFYYQYSMMLH